jgi:hypothetical protein
MCARVSRVSRVCPGSPRCLFTSKENVQQQQQTSKLAGCGLCDHKLVALSPCAASDGQVAVVGSAVGHAITSRAR